MQNRRIHLIHLVTAAAFMCQTWAGDVVAQEGQKPDPPMSSADRDMRARYDQAFGALLAGQLEAAAASFEAIARDTRDPEMRAAARELARFARVSLAQKTGHGSAPAATIPTQDTGGAGQDSDDDTTAGRTSFVISTTLSSVYAGVVLIDAFDIDSFRPGVALTLGTTAAGFAGSYLGSKGLRITEAMSDAYSLGIALGVGNSLLMSGPLDLYDSSEDVQILNLAAMALGGTTGLVLARSGDPTRAQVSFSSISSLLGIATVGLGLGILQPDADDDGDTILLLLAAGLDGGVLAGMAASRSLDWSLSRTRLVGLGAFLGALAGFGSVALLTGVDDADDTTARLWATSTLAGMWGGFALSAYLSRDMRPDRRYREPDRSLTLAPTPLRGGLGLSVGGRF